MTKMTRLDGRQHANQAGRGSLSSLEELLRALVNDEVRDIPIAGTGITTGSGTIYKSSVHERGGIITTSILIDLTGLNSNAAADIIGVDSAANCHIGQITEAINGTILGGKIYCLEAPATGEPDIDLYSAVESTGVEDAAITGLDETALLNTGADWTIDLDRALTAVPANNEYLYLVGSGAGTNATYTAGKLLIELYGYHA